MDFTQASVVGGSGNVNVGDRSYSITSEVSDGTDRSSLHSLSHGTDGLLSFSHILKHTRPANELDVYEEARGPFKLSRIDPFAHSQIDPKLRIGISSTLMRNNSMVSDGRLGCSPSNSTVSDAGFLAGDFPAMDVKPLRNDGVMVAQVYNSTGGMHGRPLGVRYQDYSVTSGLPLPMARDGLRTVNGRGPFTAEQWVEFHQHALIFKCIAGGFSPPATLLAPLRNSVSSLNRLATVPYSVPSMTFNLGSQTTIDPEPGRCRRTDGKKWRCAREVVPEQKYCERHMNRGRNRSRKSADCQASTLSQASEPVQPPSKPTSSVGNASHESSNPHIVANSSKPGVTGVNVCSQQQPSPSLGVTNLPTSCASFPAGFAPCNQLQFPFQASAAAGMAKNDLRFFSGVPKRDVGLSPEHIFLSDDAASKRVLYDHQSLNNLTMLNSVNSGFQNLPSQLKQNVPSLSQYGLTPQVKTLLDTDMAGVSQGDCLNRLPLSTGSMGSADVCRESEGQPLRRFFDDWPRSRDSATLPWPDLEDEKISKSVSNTHLSISIPTQMDFPPPNGISPRARVPPSSLKLLAARNESDRMSSDLTHMGLSMGPGVNEDTHRQPSWVSIAWENSMGGPLAEVLHSSTPRGGKNPGLNLLGEGWDGSPQDSPRTASPRGVLQKATFGSYSDSSSSASSPRTMKTEPGLRENVHSPSLPNAASHLSS